LSMVKRRWYRYSSSGRVVGSKTTNSIDGPHGCSVAGGALVFSDCADAYRKRQKPEHGVGEEDKYACGATGYTSHPDAVTDAEVESVDERDGDAEPAPEMGMVVEGIVERVVDTAAVAVDESDAVAHADRDIVLVSVEL